MSAIVFAGSSASAEEEKQRDAAVSRVIKGLPIYRALKEDAVRGGCMLSAGELDSSKEYLQQPDGSWVVAYQVRLRPLRELMPLEHQSADTSPSLCVEQLHVNPIA